MFPLQIFIHLIMVLQLLSFIPTIFQTNRLLYSTPNLSLEIIFLLVLFLFFFPFLKCNNLIRVISSESIDYNRRTNSNLVEQVYHPEDITRRIKTMPDPENLFAALEECKEYYVVVPNIRDVDGSIIMPDEYGSKLVNGSIVMVNVHLRLYVFLFFQKTILYY